MDTRLMQLPPNTALILIDIQQGFDLPYWGKRNNPHAEERMADLLAHWRTAKMPVFHVRHASLNPKSPLAPGQSGHEFKREVAPLPGEPVITKNVNSGLIGTDLEQSLRALNIDSLVMVGLTTDHCVSTTARMAANLGFNVFVVEDATATHDRTAADGKTIPAQQVHETNLASLNGEFATVVTSADLISVRQRSSAAKD
jgi:nicotinamidase-related amidase